MQSGYSPPTSSHFFLPQYDPTGHKDTRVSLVGALTCELHGLKVEVSDGLKCP